MSVEVATLFAILCLIGVLAQLLRLDWDYSISTLLRIIIRSPLVAAILFYQVSKSSTYLLFSLTSTVSIALSKALVFVFSVTVLLVAIVLSEPILYIGSVIQRVASIARENAQITRVAERIHSARDLIIDVAVEVDQRDLQLSSKAEYERQIQKAAKSGVGQLTAGESALSVLVGGLLLFGQITGTEVLELSVILPQASLIEAFIYVIAIFTLYRVTALKLLSFSGNETFESVEHMDVALSFQKALFQLTIMECLVYFGSVETLLPSCDLLRD